MVRIAGMLLALAACRGEEPVDSAASPAALAETAPEPSVPRDPLLARANAAFADGQLPSPVADEIIASEDPAHARARRILTVMRRQARDETVENAAASGSVPAGPSLSAAGIEAGAPVAAPVVAPGVEVAPDAAQAVDPPPPTAPRLAVLTRLSLTRSGETATLTVHAASALQMGLARQAGTARLVVESAGALPAVLQARPSIDGLGVSDVRRGQDTVQIAVELGEGWTPGRPTSFSGGARLKFTRR